MPAWHRGTDGLDLKLLSSLEVWGLLCTRAGSALGSVVWTVMPCSQGARQTPRARGDGNELAHLPSPGTARCLLQHPAHPPSRSVFDSVPIKMNKRTPAPPGPSPCCPAPCLPPPAQPLAATPPHGPGSAGGLPETASAPLADLRKGNSCLKTCPTSLPAAKFISN